MKFKTPSFWHKHNSLLARALRPFGKLYERISRFLEKRITPMRVSVPVICVGNLTLGGSGKTPTVLAIAELLQKAGHTPHILSRGYGGSCRHTYRATKEDSAKKIGDEACLMAQHFPVWVGKDRVSSARKAIEAGATILLMDDGLQNPHLYRDANIVVVDNSQGFGNGFIFPAGPLRTSLVEGFQKADAFFLIHSKEKTDSALENLLQTSKKPVFRINIVSNLPLPPQKVIGFAGLGYPLKFKISLERHGFEVIEFLSYPDHHTYTHHDADFLTSLQKNHNAPLLTTEKDWVKLKHLKIENLYPVPISFSIETPEGFMSFLDKKLKAGTLS